jgi:hypothetical protein
MRLTPVIPAIWEAEIGRTGVQGQLGQKVSKLSSQQTSWAWEFVSLISATQEA